MPGVPDHNCKESVIEDSGETNPKDVIPKVSSSEPPAPPPQRRMGVGNACLAELEYGGGEDCAGVALGESGGDSSRKHYTKYGEGRKANKCRPPIPYTIFTANS